MQLSTKILTSNNKRQTLKVDAIDDINSILLDDVLENNLPEPYTSRNFHNFLVEQLADENIKFYEHVIEFRTTVELFESGEKAGKKVSEDDLVAMASQILTQFVEDGSEKQINISGNLRNKTIDIVRRSSQSKSVPSSLFDEALNEVKLVMGADPFFRFVRIVRNQNMATPTKDYRIKIGIIYLILGVLTALAFILLAVFREDDKIWQNPWWRHFSIIFYFFGFFDIITSVDRICPFLALGGKFECPYQKDGAAKIECKSTKAHIKWRAKKIFAKILILSLLMTYIGIALPPSYFYDD